MRMKRSRHIHGRARMDARPGRLDADLMMGARPPVELLLRTAIRRLARERPETFERLGRFREAAFVLAPDELPIAFRVTPSGQQTQVAVVRSTDIRPCAARISGRLSDLLNLFDGSLDADAAFFSRRVRIEGETEAVVALHNTLEAAEFTLADLLGLPAPLRNWSNLVARRLLRGPRPRPADARA